MIEPTAFQSPSLRGSGRFRLRSQDEQLRSERFNPLHCGAVVASLCPGEGKLVWFGPFQSPSLRGSGRFYQGQ